MKQKILTLQSLRGFAFFFIFISHLGLATLGAWSVSVFFILSGFVMFYSYEDKELPVRYKENFTFAIKKIKRLYPLHILMMCTALVFMAAGYWLYSDRSLNVLAFDASEIILNLSLLQSFIPKEEFYFSLNSVSWYLSVSLFLYFAFPSLMQKVKRCKSVKQAIITIAIAYTVLFFLSASSAVIGLSEDLQKWLTYINPIFRLVDFLIGAYLGYIFLNKVDGGRLSRNSEA